MTTTLMAAPAKTTPLKIFRLALMAANYGLGVPPSTLIVNRSADTD